MLWAEDSSRAFLRVLVGGMSEGRLRSLPGRLPATLHTRFGQSLKYSCALRMASQISEASLSVAETGIFSSGAEEEEEGGEARIRSEEASTEGEDAEEEEEAALRLNKKAPGAGVERRVGVQKRVRVGVSNPRQPRASGLSLGIAMPR